MATCAECVHVEVCRFYINSYAEKAGVEIPAALFEDCLNGDVCEQFKDRSQFVELKHAEWDEHEDMYGDPVYCCSNCREKYFLEEWTPIENCYFYCPNCGAKMDEQALKEREEDESKGAGVSDR